MLLTRDEYNNEAQKYFLIYGWMMDHMYDHDRQIIVD